MVKRKTTEVLEKIIATFKKGANIPTQWEKMVGASEENYWEIFNAPQDALLIHDPKTGYIVDVNQRACEMLKHSREEIIKDSVGFLSSGESPYTQEEALRWIRKVLSEGPQTFEWLAKDNENKLFCVEVNLKRCVIMGNERILATWRDITERKQAEKQMIFLQDKLRQAQKMEAIGQVAGSIAHDFNNLLAVIIGQCQLSLRGIREDDPLNEKLKNIERATEQATGLARQLLAFSRRQILEMKVTDLNIILGDLEKMLHPLIGEHVELKTVPADDLGLVKVDPGQMVQVIINLAVNARDAMPDGGKLVIETANVEMDERDRLSHIGMLPGAYVMLSVTDTGIGMTEEVKEQIFDPFFTTKEKGKGTGLGLSTVYGIVKQSGGYIYVYSEVGKGTTFKIYFPQLFEPQEKFKKEGEEKEVTRGTETILVVEDDENVRTLAIDILGMQGYTILEATKGEEALRICEEHKKPIHLVLTDMVMPNMSSSQLIERLTQVRADFKVLYMTGYSDEAIIHNGLLDKTINLIHKPFTIVELARKVREVLDKN